MLNPNSGGVSVRRPDFERAGEVLARTHGEFVVSKHKLRQAEGIQLVRLKREQGNQTLGFSSRPFVLCGLPVRRPPAGQLLYERRNGHFVLQVTGHPDFGLPFGQDRLVPIFLATLAVRQQSQTIRFKSAAEMLETFGMHKGGKEYRRLVAAFERIFGATIFFGTDSLTTKARVVQRSRFNFLREAQIWYNRRPDQRVLDEEFENVIVLSDEFYQEILAHPIPTDLEAVKVLASAPAVLDLFMWLTYRCFVCQRAGVDSDLRAVRGGEPNRVGRVLPSAAVSRHVGAVAGDDPGDVARMPGANLVGWPDTRDCSGRRDQALQ